MGPSKTAIAAASVGLALAVATVLYVVGLSGGGTEPPEAPSEPQVVEGLTDSASLSHGKDLPQRSSITQRVEGGSAQPAPDEDLRHPALSGKVISEFGTGVQGLSVTHSDIALTYTESNGLFIVRDLPSQHGLLAASGNGFCTIEPATFLGQAESLLILVSRELDVSGAIVDDAGLAVADAAVTIAVLEEQRRAWAELGIAAADTVSWSTKTGADGTFLLEGIADGPRRFVSVLHPDFEPFTERYPIQLPPNLSIELTRAEGWWIAGEVRSVAGEAIGGASVSLGEGVLCSSQNGSFRISAGERDSVTLAVLAPGFLPWSRELAEVSTAGHSISVELEPGELAIRGRVVNRGGGGVQGARVFGLETTLHGTREVHHGPMVLQAPVRVEDILGSGCYEESGMLVTETDIEGRFELAGLARREYTLVASGPSMEQSGILVVSSGTDGWQLVLEEGRASLVEGRVVDEDGKPIEGAEVTARRTLSTSARRLLPLGRIAHTDAAGSFSLGMLCTRNLTLDASAAGFIAEIKPFAPELEVQTISLRAPVTVQVKLAAYEGGELAELLDSEQKRIRFTREIGGQPVTMARDVLLNGCSAVLTTTREARFVRLSRGGEELGIYELELQNGQLNILQL